jgi:hypothetical protein
MAKAKAKPKNPAAVALAARRMVRLTPARRTAIARQAVQARWAKQKGKEVG